MPQFLKVVLKRLEAYLQSQAQTEQNAYLSEARDVVDLEQRLRHLERQPAPGNMFSGSAFAPNAYAGDLR